MRRIDGFIGGKSAKGDLRPEGDVFNPNTGEVQAKVGFATPPTSTRRCRRRRRRSPSWSAVNPQRRARVMFEFKRLVEANMDAAGRAALVASTAR